MKPGLSFLGANGSSCWRSRADCERGGGRLLERGVAVRSAGAPSGADRVEHPRLDVAPDVARPEVVSVGAVDRGDRHLRGRQRRLQTPVEREALQRVVGRADAVEVAAEPAGAQLLARRADLPEVARGEVRLVRVGVADARASPTTLPSPCSVRERRPATGASAGGGPRANGTPADVGSAELRAELAVERVADRGEQRERVGAAVEEDGDEHLLRPGRRRPRRCPPRTRAAGAPRRRRPRARAPAVRAGSCAGRGRCRRAAACPLRSRAARGRPRQRRAGGARCARSRCSSGPSRPYEVWRSGETATSRRRAFVAQEPVARLLPVRVRHRPSLPCAKRTSASSWPGGSSGCPRTRARRRRAPAARRGSAGRLLVGERERLGRRSSRPPSGRGRSRCRASARRPSRRRSAG